MPDYAPVAAESPINASRCEHLLIHRSLRRPIASLGMVSGPSGRPPQRCQPRARHGASFCAPGDAGIPGWWPDWRDPLAGGDGFLSPGEMGRALDGGRGPFSRQPLPQPVPWTAPREQGLFPLARWARLCALPNAQFGTKCGGQAPSERDVGMPWRQWI